MAASKAVRADDVSGLNIATNQLTDSDLVVKDYQRICINDPSTAANQAAVSGAGALRIDPTGTTVQPVSGTVGVSTTSFGVKPLTSGGLSIYHVVSAATDNAANVKASAGQLFGWSIYNNAGYPVYVKFHNTAGTPTSGSGVVKAIGVQAGTRSEAFTDAGIAFGTGIGISIVKGITDASTTAVALSDCIVDVFYA